MSVPILNRHDICSAWIVRSRAAMVGDNRASQEKPPSIIARLALPDLVQNIMNAKRSIVYFNTSNVDRSLLSPELASSLPDCKILINEIFSSSEFTEYIWLKDTDRKLGLKFIWYCNGRILVWWKERERIHVIKTASNLGVVMASLGLGATELCSGIGSPPMSLPVPREDCASS